MQTLPSVLPPAEIGTAHTEKPVTNRDQHHLAPLNGDGNLPTREEAGEYVFNQCKHWMEEGYSQVLTREQGLQIACWALKIAGARQELLTHVIAELVELPDSYG